MGIIPFSVPANLSAFNLERPGWGNELAWKVQQRFLASGEIPIVEVLNRQDWPGKKEEFFTGNFGAIAIGREAGYDLIMVGFLEPLNSNDSMTAYTKVIETESGMTLWYGKTSVYSYQPELRGAGVLLGLETNDPAKNYNFFKDLADGLPECLVNAALSTEPLPE